MSRLREWWANPWGRPRFLVVFTLLYLAWSILPILIAVRFSFNEGRSRSTSQGWSLRWYYEDPDLSVWHDPDLRAALFQSLRLSAIAVLVTVPLGVALAIGLTRWRGRGAGTARGITLATLVTPENGARKPNFSHSARRMSARSSASIPAAWHAEWSASDAERCDGCTGPNRKRAIVPVCTMTPGSPIVAAR